MVVRFEVEIVKLSLVRILVSYFELYFVAVVVKAFR